MELANILELIHAVSDSDLTEFNLQDDTLNISMSKEKTIVQQMAVNTDPADAQQYQPVVQQAVHENPSMLLTMKYRQEVW